VFIRVMGGNLPGYFDYNAPDLRSTVFRLGPLFVCALIYTVALQIRLLAPRRWLHLLVVVFITVTFGWASLLYVGHRTHGVTGTDPYAYAQMGIDLATRGTPLHRFTLFPNIASLDVTWSPIVHIGYHIPINADGDAPSVWPPGASLAMAVAYRIAGEVGLYLVNPIASLLLLVATGWFAGELFADVKHRAWIVALSIAILATSHTLFDWATVPMADSQAALFSVLAMGLAMRFARQPRLAWAMLSGLALGAAYFVRHTQLLIVPAMCVLFWMNSAPRGLRVRALVAAGLAALVVALPDLWYHHIIFGHYLIPESRELDLFSIASLAKTLGAFITDLLAAREFGWLVPFIVYGAYRLARDQRIAFIALAVWVLVLFGFHWLYPALRLRDLLPQFPPLVIVSAWGIVAFVTRLWRDVTSWRAWLAATGLIVTFFVLLIRVWNVIPIPFGEPQRSFGYLTFEQRAAFEHLAALTPPRAVIGSTLNSGAIELYARRETFLPTLWSAREQDIFFEAMFREGRAIYFLDDSAAMTTLRHQLAERYTLRQISALDVPLWGSLPGDTSSALWEIVGTDDR
ncbi:MAG: hypothetical protein N2559_14145, partial [Anaerolineae bacterium]|nr:hypothetical protein [Anaerolineae bacterium]